MHISVKENSFNALWYIRAERKPDVTDMLSHENRTTARVSFIHVFFFSGGHVEVDNALGCLMCKSGEKVGAGSCVLLRIFASFYSISLELPTATPTSIPGKGGRRKHGNPESAAGFRLCVLI